MSDNARSPRRPLTVAPLLIALAGLALACSSCGTHGTATTSIVITSTTVGAAVQSATTTEAPTTTEASTTTELAATTTESTITTEAAAQEPLQLVEAGYSYVQGYLEVAVIVRNPNADWYANSSTLRAITRDAGGRVLGTFEWPLPGILSAQTIGWAARGDLKGSKPAAVDFEIVNTLLGPQAMETLGASSFVPLEVAGLEAKKTGSKVAFVGEVVNKNTYPLHGVSVSILLRDKAGKLVGGVDGGPLAGDVAEGTSTKFELNAEWDLPAYSSMEGYAYMLP
jgi:hypothetical protein